ncbi:hypothetical protein PT226_01015 [Erysipelothrix rhusiopathiae]|uniref:hypothetical protein n=1 Tax=Erysipelothrix rhusiopathiae TaxID=1648 RepID=UPI0023B19205|nr:hypothetical protein [Erysipelothrix rhusiopathiae]MDE8339015.1 hypothetical protein [Erysipelothrix rhusiopathiae]
MKKLIVPALIAAAGYGLYKYINEPTTRNRFLKPVMVPTLGRDKDIYVGEKHLYSFYISKGDFTRILKEQIRIKQAGFDLNINESYTNMRFEEMILPRMDTNSNDSIQADVIASYRENGSLKVGVIKEMNIGPDTDVRERRITRKDLEMFAARYQQNDIPGVITVRFHLKEAEMFKESLNLVVLKDKTLFIFEPGKENEESGQFGIHTWFGSRDQEATFTYEMAYHFGDFK